MTRHRLTIRGEGVELRGRVDDLDLIYALANAVAPHDCLVMMSEAPDGWVHPMELDAENPTPTTPEGSP